MLVLEVLMGLKYKQGYVASEFIHVDVDKGENIYVETSRGFK